MGNVFSCREPHVQPKEVGCTTFSTEGTAGCSYFTSRLITRRSSVC